MAQLPNSPPTATEKPSGPVFHESVDKVTVTSGGALGSTQFKGKTFTREGEPVSVSSLGWDHADLAAAEANPNLVIERFNKKGQLIKKDGTPYPTVGQLTPKAKTEGVNTIAGTKPEKD